MSIINIVLIHHLVEDLDLLESAFENSVVVRYVNQDTAGVISEIAAKHPDLDYSNISHLALVFHPYDRMRLPFFSSTGASQFQAISRGLVDLIAHVKGTKASIYVDLLACSLRYPPFVQSVKLAKQELQVQFRYSLDDTGNATNWVLESHGEDVKDHYFNDSILQWHHVLFPNWASSTFGSKAPFFKLIYDENNVSTGQVQRLHREVDIDGNPLNPLLDENGVNINYGPAQAVQVGTGSAWFGTEDFPAKFDLVKNTLTDVKSVVGNYFAYAALKADDTVVSWGYANWDYDDIYDWQRGPGVTYPASDLNNVKALYATAEAFAALKFDGTVVTWGGEGSDGDSSHVQDLLTNVSIVYSNDSAFAALKNDGTVVTWGDLGYGIELSVLQSQLTNVVAIYCANKAFAALRSNGTVIAWGDRMYNLDNHTVLTVPFTDVQSQLINVVAVYATQHAFAALRVDGSVVTWGGDGAFFASGGNSQAVEEKLHDVVSIHSNRNAFAAVKADGSVVTWGRLEHGGDSSAVQLESNVVTVYSTLRAFAALKSDGSVVTWGLGLGGSSIDAGDSTAVQAQLTNVVAMYSSAVQFAALKSDGSVVTWGGNWWPNIAPVESTAVQSDLTDIVTIFSNEGAFAALKNDGTLVTWGSETYGGDSSSVQSELVNVKFVYGSDFNMVALVETSVPDASPAPDPALPNAPPATVRFAVIALASAITRSTDGSVYIGIGVQLKLKKGRFNTDDTTQARQDLQNWINGAQDISNKTSESPLLPDVPSGDAVRVYTEGDVLYVHDQSINLAGLSEHQDNVTVYSFEGSIYQATVIFFGGSGGAEITNIGDATAGSQTFAPDQVIYDSTSDDGNITIYAGVVSQGTDTYAVSAPRLPATDTLYTTDVSIGVGIVNEAMAPFTFSFNEQSQQVTITSVGNLQSKALLSDVLFDTRRLSNTERRQHAENCLMALTDQIANDIPDEFTSGEEAMMRLGISIQTVDELLQVADATNPMSALVQNLQGTPWAQDEMYTAYGSSLLRNIVLSLCSLKPSRIQGGKAVFVAGDEIAFYVTFTGVIRVSATRELERFGLSQTEIEQNQAALDEAAWVRYKCRLVR